MPDVSPVTLEATTFTRKSVAIETTDVPETTPEITPLVGLILRPSGNPSAPKLDGVFVAVRTYEKG